MLLVGSLAFLGGRSAIIWGFLGFTFGGWMLIPLVLFGPKPDRIQRKLEVIQKFVQQIEEKKPEGYKDFDTVDDLMKQLEKK
jgi:hypothetical protein